MKQKGRLLIGIATTLIILIVGIFSSIKGVWLIVNYINPYLFGLLFGGLGFVIGFLVYYRIFIANKNKRVFDEFPALICFLLGFIGLFLFISPYFNRSVSRLERCENYRVISKDKKVSSSSRNPKIYSLYIAIDGNPYRLISSSSYWDKISVGDDIMISFYKSKIGFDFVKLNDDNK